MTDSELRDLLRELMQQWDTWRAKWIARFGTDENFGAWFTQQITKPK